MSKTRSKRHGRSSLTRTQSLNRTRIRKAPSVRRRTQRIRRAKANQQSQQITMLTMTAFLALFLLTFLQMQGQSKSQREVSVHPITLASHDFDDYQRPKHNIKRVSHNCDDTENNIVVAPIDLSADSSHNTAESNSVQEECQTVERTISVHQQIDETVSHHSETNPEDCGDCGHCDACNQIKNEVVISYEEENPFEDYGTELGNYVFEISNAPKPGDIPVPKPIGGNGSGTNVEVNIGDFNVQGGNAISESNSNAVAEANSNAESFSTSNAANDNQNINENNDNDDRRFTAGVYSNNDNRSNAVSQNEVNPKINVSSKNDLRSSQNQKANLKNSNRQKVTKQKRQPKRPKSYQGKNQYYNKYNKKH